MVNTPSLLVYYRSNTCDPGLPCIIWVRSRREKAIPSALRAMLEFPKLITINQTESIEGFSEGRNSTDCQLRVDCETESMMTYLHRKPHRETRVRQYR